MGSRANLRIYVLIPLLVPVVAFAVATVGAQNGAKAVNIRKVSADHVSGALVIHGRNFCLNPLVTLASTPLELVSVEIGDGADSITVAVPADMRPAGYRLRVACGFNKRNQALGDSFDLGGGGAVGEAGPPGPQGPTGPRGSDGAAGATGPAGASGADGATGATGPAGPTGATGPAGPAGATGATGATGVTGATCADGATGATGATGADGVSGWERITSTLTVASKTTSQSTVVCSSGEKVLGGGATSPSGGDDEDIDLVASGPSSDTQWEVRINNDSKDSVTYTSHIICATV